MIDIEGAEKVTIYNNESLFFECETLPEHFVVIGGGPIGCEMAQAFQRLGSQVYVINRGARLLSQEPENVSRILQDRFEAEGIAVYNQAEVKAFGEGSARIVMKGKGDIELPCSAALLAIGRVVNTRNLGLENAGISLTERGRIKVDTYLRTSNRRVYAVGDAAGSYMFSHGAEKMVRQLWNNLLIPFSRKKNTQEDLSWVTFTDPQVAHFGLTQKQMDKQGIPYYRQDQTMESDDRAIIQEYKYGHLSVWMRPYKDVGSRTVLSGSMIAPQAGELIQELELAKHARVPIGKITERVYPYPVATRINQKTLRGVMSQGYSEWKKRLARFAFRLKN